MRGTFSGCPALLVHRRLPLLAGAEHMLLSATDLRLEQFVTRREAQLPPERVSRQTTPGGVFSLPQHEEVPR